MSKHVVILGGGPGGLSASLTARQQGLSVTLLDPEPPGGNALNHSLVPSKFLLNAVATIEHGRRLGSRWHREDWDQVMANQHRAMEEMQQMTRRWLDRQGVRYIPESGRLVRGEARPAAVETPSGERLEADVVVIATGSKQRLVPGAKPDGQRVMIPRVFHMLKAVPEEIAIIGAGATGLEAASLFIRLGTRVTVYHAGTRPLADFSPELSRTLADRLAAEGVQFVWGARITGLEARPETVVLHWTENGVAHEAATPHVLLASGRIPVFAADELRPLGFELDPKGFFAVDPLTGQTSVAGVYAVGDAAGGSALLANRAVMQGKQAILHAVGQSAVPTPVVEAIYTIPEIARVGSTQGTRRYRAELPNGLILKPFLEQMPETAVEVVTDADGIVLGGEALGPHAADLMNVVALAVAAQVPVDHLQRVSYASPTIGEILSQLA